MPSCCAPGSLFVPECHSPAALQAVRPTQLMGHGEVAGVVLVKTGQPTLSERCLLCLQLPLSSALPEQESLGCLPPSLEPKATDFIPQMVDTIQRIIANGHAYAVGGDVFFDVASLPGYGKLSGRSQVRRVMWCGVVAMRPCVCAVQAVVVLPLPHSLLRPLASARAGGQPRRGARGGG